MLTAKLTQQVVFIVIKFEGNMFKMFILLKVSHIIQYHFVQNNKTNEPSKGGCIALTMLDNVHIYHLYFLHMSHVYLYTYHFMETNSLGCYI